MKIAAERLPGQRLMPFRHMELWHLQADTDRTAGTIEYARYREQAKQ
jgi:hypothetical protein